MNKLISTILFVFLVTGFAFASPQRSVIIDANTESALKIDSKGHLVDNGISLGTRTVVNNDINASQTTVYKDAVWNATVKDLSGYKYIVVETYMNTTGGTYDLTPLFGDATVANYTKGQKRTITGNERFVLEVDGESEFNILLDGKTGASNCTTWITGY